MPRSPALYASAAELDEAEAPLDISELIGRAMDTAALEKYSYIGGKVERTDNVSERDSTAPRTGPPSHPDGSDGPLCDTELIAKSETEQNRS